MAAKYDTECYRRFVDNLRTALDGPNIREVDLPTLRDHALPTGVRTRLGSTCWRSAVSSRMAQKTVFLGSEAVRLPRTTPVQDALIEAAPDELHKVLHLMRSFPFVRVRRQMGDNREFGPICNLYISVADPKNWRIAYCWASTLRQPDRRSAGPELTMIHIPEEHSLRMQILSLPEHDLNIALGTDYTGEEKKGFLRQGMYRADLRGMLGLHAGTKLVRVRDARDHKLRTYGVFMFGLTATGKSTWSCHQLGLDPRADEETLVAQDDIVFLRPDGSALGSEPRGFYVKTDVDRELQEAMWWALTDSSALLENVMVDAAGKVDFLDECLGENGRAVILRDKLRVMRGRKLSGISAKSVDLPPLEQLDGLVFAFITRRNTLMSFAQELTPEQGVLAYLWGESTHSYATRPELAGESVRVVGTDDFIVGPQGRKVNRFHQIVRGLCDRFPGKVRFFQYNTGGMGELLETVTEGGARRKRLLRKATRVPISLMAAIQRGDLRGSNRYQPGPLGTREIVSCEGASVAEYDPRRFYDQAQIDAYVADILEGRRRFTEQIAGEGLQPEIVRLAEQSFEALGMGSHRDTLAVPRAATAPATFATAPAAGLPTGPAASAPETAPAASLPSRPGHEAQQPSEPQVPVSSWITPWTPLLRPPRSFRY